MIFLTQDGTNILDVKYVFIKDVEGKFVIFGQDKSIEPFKLGEFDSKERAKGILSQIDTTRLNVIPEF